MKKQNETPEVVADAPAAAEPPQKVDTSMVGIHHNVRVIDVETGKVIDKVISADAEAGKLTRYAVEKGNLVRDGDRFQMIEEERKIRIEWIKVPTE